MNEDYIIGDLIKELRKDKGWTQVELAKRVHVNRTTIGGYETGRIQPPRAMVIKLADLFDVNVDYLYGRTRNSTSWGNLNATLKLTKGKIETGELIKKFKKLTPSERSAIIDQIDYYISKKV